MPTEFKYDITQYFDTISSTEAKTGRVYAKEVNLVAYGESEPKYDIRSWIIETDGTRKLGKGITLTREEMQKLKEILEDMEDELRD